jgi:hypothetical protein
LVKLNVSVSGCPTHTLLADTVIAVATSATGVIVTTASGLLLTVEAGPVPVTVDSAVKEATPAGAVNVTV